MPTQSDFSARDDTIRRLTYTPLRRREGVPQEAFDAYWRDVHGPLCARLPGLGYYVQHHFDASRDANLWPLPNGVTAMAVTLDGMVEIGFANADNQRWFEAASPLLFKDERNFICHDVAYALPEGSQTLVDRDPDAVPNRPVRGHLHVHFGGRKDGLANAVTALAEALAASQDIVALQHARGFSSEGRLHLYSRWDPDHLRPARQSPGDADRRLGCAQSDAGGCRTTVHERVMRTQNAMQA
jgi:hypothetical protein